MAEKIKMKKPDNFTPITLDEFKKHYKPPRNPYKEVTQKTGKLAPPCGSPTASARSGFS